MLSLWNLNVKYMECLEINHIEILEDESHMQGSKGEINDPPVNR